MTKPKITREQWLNAFAAEARPHFKRVGAPLPKNIRCSIGFPSSGIRSKVIGQCWTTKVSTDGHAEIFIRPSLQSDSSRVADVLTHELIHAALGIEEGHGKEFKRVAHALGLGGKMTATIATDEWHEWADPILKKIGKLPGADLKGMLPVARKKQTTRLIKLECDTCDWTCRTTKLHIEGYHLACPTECDGSLTVA